jgi:hypothetical protein
MALYEQPGQPIGESARRRIDNAAEALVKYMLFTDEALLDAPVKGTSGFAAEFAARGARDHAGRSLRDFDLTRRMFRYPCSYLIYSAAFDALPAPARDRIYRRLWEVLTGADQTPAFSRLTATDWKAIHQILLATKSDLPAYWRSSVIAQ